LQEERLKTGTTTVGLACKDCVILAAESKSTLGFMVSSKRAEKIHQIDDKIALTIAGGVGDAQAIIRLLRAEINLYKLTRNAEFTVKAVTTLLANVLQSSRFYPYMMMPIIGGIDKYGEHVFSVDPVGGIEKDRYISTGSGSPMAYGVLENDFKDGLTKEEGTRLAVRAVRAARERDVFSGGEDITVVTIDNSGVNFVDKEKIKEFAK